MISCSLEDLQEIIGGEGDGFNALRRMNKVGSAECNSAYFASLFCDASTLEWRGHKNSAGVDGPQGCEDNDDLYARHESARASGL